MFNKKTAFPGISDLIKSFFKVIFCTFGLSAIFKNQTVIIKIQIKANQDIFIQSYLGESVIDCLAGVCIDYLIKKCVILQGKVIISPRPGN